MQNQDAILDSSPEYDEFLAHIGCTQEESNDPTPTGSGRYLKGSGENPLQHPKTFADRLARLKRDGWVETAENIRMEFGCSTTEFRAMKKIADHEERAKNVDLAKSLMEKHNGNRSAVAREMSDILGRDVRESTIRSWLDAKTATRKSAAQTTAELIKKELDTKGAIDVGRGVELELGISQETLKESLTMLEMEGYLVTSFGLKQVTGKANQQTTTKVIMSPDKMKASKKVMGKEREDRVKAARNMLKEHGGDIEAAAKALGYKNSETLQRLLDPTKKLDIREPMTETQAQNYLMNHPGEIQSMADYHSSDGGHSYKAPEYPASLDSNRVMIRHGDEGGHLKDGTIEIRRGVKDLSLGDSHYAQVRILVDETHYMKGMAFYSDDDQFPPGVDVIYNRPENSSIPDKDIFKKIKTDDPSNPFGATIKANGQNYYIGDDGKEHLGVINKIKEEGDWSKQQLNLSQQFLSKQPIKFIKSQLDITYADYEAEFDEIMSINNPTVRKKCLEDFAGSCDNATVTLKAAAMPKQRSRVILPIESLKDNEVYAPDYKNGTKVMMIRYPHGGTFEIATATVNNKNKEAIRVMGRAFDAVGINSNVASRLSGADFDGDSVTIFPMNDKIKFEVREPLKGLVGFEPKALYSFDRKEVDAKGVEHYYRNGKEYKVMPKTSTNKEMGIASNLITDMTLQGASDKELERAVRHSMVVIDAAKHHLDYMASYRENDIQSLKNKYQHRIVDGEDKYGGASTLLSQRKQDVAVPERRGQAMIDKETGEVSYKTTGRKYVDKKGNLVEATVNIPRMMSVDDARVLSTGTDQENAYADYANKMKALANRARKEYVNTPNMAYDRQARKTYAAEVESLEMQVKRAESNAPRERRAQAIANSKLKSMTAANPNLPKDKKTYSKLKQRIMVESRDAVDAGGKKNRITLTQREWDAINNGAVSDSFAQRIFKYCEDGQVRSYATPKSNGILSEAKQSQIKSRWHGGMSKQDIAESLGISLSTVEKYLSGVN